MRSFFKFYILIITFLLTFSNITLTSQAMAQSSTVPANEVVPFIIEHDQEVYIPNELEPVGIITKDSSIHIVHENDFAYFFQWGEGLGYIKKNQENNALVTEGLPADIEATVTTAGTIDSTIPFPVYTTEKKPMAIVHQSYPYTKEQDEYFEVIIGEQIGYVFKADLAQPIEEQTKKEEEVTITAPVQEASSIPNKLVEAQKTSDFTPTTKYFKVQVDELTVYTNKTGELIPIGTLYKGQSYERISDAGNWHRIRFGNEAAFVLKQSTMPAIKAEIPNLNPAADTNKTVTTINKTEVFDNSSGSLMKFAEVKEHISYPIVGQMGNWYKINIAGRLGYIHADNVQVSFSASDKFFSAKVDQLGMYENRNGKLVKVGELKKNDSYKRIRDYGNWHQLNAGGKIVYVLKADTVPSSSSTIKNATSQKSSSNFFTTRYTTPVFDNSTGALVQFGQFNPKEKVHYIGKMGNWYTVEFGGRLGYIHENNVLLPFKKDDKYFEVLEEDVYVYDNSMGYLRKVALLTKGQTYARIADYGENWHQIKFGRQFGYVLKSSTKPSFSNKAANWGTPVNSKVDFIANGNVEIFDNSSGKLVPFITIMDTERYPIIGESGSWWKISVANRIGYIHKSKVTVGPIYSYSNYNHTYNEMLEIQYGLNPQTDKYRNNPAYVHKDYIQVKQGGFPTKGIVTANTLNVREDMNSNAWIYGTVKLGQELTIIKQVGDWYQIEFSTWRNAKKSDVGTYLNPSNIKQGTTDYFQHLVLSQNAGANAADLESRILYDKGILKGKGQAFVQASVKHKINEIYLISHALLETGNGTSNLANGILVDTVDGKSVQPRMVYNMFGIGAIDSCPNTCGAETAYKYGWFTPEASIMGGAEFISSMYINHPTYKQNTLYKMRWNPGKPGTHQYATDIAWGYKQVARIKQLYDLLDHYTLYFDVPVYK